MDVPLLGFLLAVLEIGWPGTAPVAVKPGATVILRAEGMEHASSVRAWVGAQETKALLRPLRVVVPLDAPRQCGVPLQVQVPGRPPSNTLALPITDGDACRPPENFPRLAPRASVAIVLTVRARVRDMEGPGLVEREKLSAAAVRLAPGGEVWGYPSAGACATASATGDQAQANLSSGLAAILSQLPGEGVSLGPALTIDSASHRRRALPVPGVEGAYDATLGGAGFPLLLDRGALLQGEGFSVRLPPPPPLEWKERDTLREAPRAAGLTLHWRGAASGSVLILAGAQSPDRTRSGLAVCRAAASAGVFTVPARALVHLPAGGPGAVVMSALSAQPCQAFSAPGVDAACALVLRAEGAAITWR